MFFALICPVHGVQCTSYKSLFLSLSSINLSTSVLVHSCLRKSIIFSKSVWNHPNIMGGSFGS